jgi:hypothetical protein
VPTVFLSNVMLQRWTDQGRALLEDTTLTLVQDRQSVALTPAVRFTRLVDGGVDPHRLIGTVKTKDQLATLGAEHYMDSVILGDVGYTVVEGFRGELAATPAGHPVAMTSVPATAGATSVPGSVAGAFDQERAPGLLGAFAAPPLEAADAAATAQRAASAPPTPADDVDAPPPRPIGVSAADAVALSEIFLSTVRGE